MDSAETIAAFIAFLASVRSMFRQTHLFAEKEPAVRDVSTSVDPFKGEPSDYAEDGVTLSIALNANLRNPPDPGQQAIGMSLLIRRSEGKWIAEAEVGWTGREIGWNPFASREARFVSPSAFADEVPPLVRWMDETFREALAGLSRQNRGGHG